MALPTFETLLYDVQDGIATVTLHRPEKLNAFTTQMRDDLVAVFDETDKNDDVRVVIITGALAAPGASGCALQQPEQLLCSGVGSRRSTGCWCCVIEHQARI